MQMEGSGQGEVAALRERGQHQTRETPQVLIAIGERGKALSEGTGLLAIVPVVPQMSVYVCVCVCARVCRT